MRRMKISAEKGTNALLAQSQDQKSHELVCEVP